MRIINGTNPKFFCGSWQCPLDEDANSHYVIIFPISILFGGSTKATPFPTAVFFLPTNMLSSATRERQWGGRPAATRLVYTAANRVQLAPTPRLQTPKPTGKLATGGWAHQNTSTSVFEFVPQPTLICCKKKRCMSQFLSANDPRVTAARAPLYDANLPPSHRRQAMRDAWHNKLVVQHKGSYKPVCMTAAIKIFVVARATLALTAKPAKAKSSVSRGVANAARANKSVSVAAWLTLTKSTLDVMPDQGWYMLPVARKGTLFEQYELDAAAWPHLYTRCKQSHFLLVWAKMFPEIRL